MPASCAPLRARTWARSSRDGLAVADCSESSANTAPGFLVARRWARAARALVVSSMTTAAMDSPSAACTAERHSSSMSIRSNSVPTLPVASCSVLMLNTWASIEAWSASTRAADAAAALDAVAWATIASSSARCAAAVTAWALAYSAAATPASDDAAISRNCWATSSSCWRTDAASPSNWATTPESITWPRSRSTERRRSANTCTKPRARPRKFSTRTNSSLMVLSPRADKSASSDITAVSSAESRARTSFSVLSPAAF